jgi:Spy/CpxP family protein refolding chaperone
MKTKMLVGVGALAAVVLGVGAAWAAGGHHHHGFAGMENMISARIAKLEDAVNATPEQRAQIDQSKQTVLNALKERAQNRRQNHGQLMQMLTADKLDTNALYAMANQHAQEIQDLAKVIVPEIQKVHDVLTPQQRQMLAQKVQQMHEHHQQGGFGGPNE